MRRLDANADHARQEQNHGVWSRLRCPPETLQTGSLDLPYLIDDEPPAFHVATQFRQRVRRDRLTLGRTQATKALGGLLQLRIEVADAEPRQGRFHAIDDASLLANEVVPLTVGPLGIFVLDGGDRDHLAVITLAAQPAQKGTL